MSRFTQDNKIIAVFTVATIIMMALAAIISSMFLVQNRISTKNRAAELTIRKPVTCSWLVTNNGSGTYDLSNFTARVTVLQQNGIVWDELTSVTVDASYNAPAGSSGQGRVTFPNLTIESGGEYRCVVDLDVKADLRSEIGMDLCTAPFRSPTFLYVIPGDTIAPRIPTAAPSPTTKPIPTIFSGKSPKCTHAQFICPQEQSSQRGLITGNLRYEDPQFQCAKLTFGNGRETTDCAGLSSNGVAILYNQIRPADLNMSDINSSTSTYSPEVQGIAPNNNTCTCAMRVSVPYCTAPRTLDASDGVTNQCNNYCNFTFQKPAPNSCLTYENKTAVIRLLYSDSGSLDFGDTINNAKIFFSDYSNALNYAYTYRAPGVYDVMLTCHNTPAGQQKCIKRIVVTGELTEEGFAEEEAVTPTMGYEARPTPQACIPEKPLMGVEINIEKCAECYE